MSDLVSAASQLQRDHPTEFGDAEILAQVYGLFILAYASGALVGPAVAGLLKANVGWGAATSALAGACGLACLPVVLETI